jgi:transcriptional regulator with XRE-family HTH domain
MLANNLASGIMEEKLLTKRLKDIRTRKKLTLERLARLTGLSKGYLSQVENSEDPPPIHTLARISLTLREPLHFRGGGFRLLRCGQAPLGQEPRRQTGKGAHCDLFIQAVVRREKILPAWFGISKLYCGVNRRKSGTRDVTGARSHVKSAVHICSVNCSRGVSTAPKECH